MSFGFGGKKNPVEKKQKSYKSFWGYVTFFKLFPMFEIKQRAKQIIICRLKCIMYIPK